MTERRVIRVNGDPDCLTRFVSIHGRWEEESRRRVYLNDNTGGECYAFPATHWSIDIDSVLEHAVRHGITATDAIADLYPGCPVQIDPILDNVQEVS